MKAVFLDINGVLHDNAGPIAGALEALELARQRGFLIRFVTNTATRNHQQILAELAGMGFELDGTELFTAPLAARQYVLRHGLSPWCLVHSSLRDSFDDLRPGNGQRIDSVVLGDARDDLTYDNLNKVFRLVRQGIPLIGIGKNRYFIENQHWMLDAGAFIHAIEWATGSQAIIMGKPSADFFQELVASCNLEPHECLMVGDDVEADVGGAMAAGLQGCLVQTGKYQPQDLKRLPSGGKVIASIADLSQLLAADLKEM